MSSPVAAASEAVQDSIGSYTPQNIVPDLETMLHDLPGLWRTTADSFQGMTDRLEQEMPLEPAVAEHYREMLATLSGLADHCEEGIGVFETAHEREMERLRNPRNEEQKWDVTANEA